MHKSGELCTCSSQIKLVYILGGICLVVGDVFGGDSRETTAGGKIKCLIAGGDQLFQNHHPSGGIHCAWNTTVY